MPIYAYKCSSCGYARDVLQKVSDAPLTQCPQCEAGTFSKQLTAAGFQLRGSGWYATDFKNGSSKSNGTAEAKGSDSKGSDSGSKGSGSDGAAKSEKTTSASSGSCGHGGCSACS
jgi:putative FmdB family regulatory protein